MQKKDQEPFELPTELTELHDLAEILWGVLFGKTVKQDKAERKETMRQYNLTAAKINEIQGFKVRMIVNASTRIESTKTEVAKRLPGQDLAGYKTQQQLNGEPVLADEPDAASQAPKEPVAAKKVKTIKPAAPAKVAKVVALPIVTGKDPKPPKPGSLIAQILDLYRAGKSNKEIIAAGFNKSTVARQVGEYKKRISEIK